MKDLIGQTFGQLTVLRFLRSDGHNRFWECLCSCGGITEATTGKLNYGHKTSCGCGANRHKRNHKRGSNHKNWTGFKDISGSIWHRIETSAEKRGINFDISIEEAWNIFIGQDKKCALSGESISFAEDSEDLRNGLNTASLDRIDSSKGYTKDNVQWVHVKINYMKQWFDQNEFIELCKKVAEHAKRDA